MSKHRQTNTNPQPEAVAETLTVDVTATPAPDENAGMGGSYTRDPDTGERVLVARTTGCCG